MINKRYFSSTSSFPSKFQSSLIRFSGGRCFSTSFHLFSSADAIYYYLSSSFKGQCDSYIVRNFVSKEDFKNLGYSSVMIPYQVLSSKVLLCKLRNVKYLKTIKTLYHVNLLKKKGGFMTIGISVNSSSWFSWFGSL